MHDTVVIAQGLCHSTRARWKPVGTIQERALVADNVHKAAHEIEVVFRQVCNLSLYTLFVSKVIGIHTANKITVILYVRNCSIKGRCKPQVLLVHFQREVLPPATIFLEELSRLKVTGIVQNDECRNVDIGLAVN